MVDLKVVGSPFGTRTFRFLIDSGANRSFLFPGSATRNAGTVGLTMPYRGREVLLGYTTLVTPSSKGVSAAGSALMRKLGVQGTLGVDFLKSHDVLIDNRKRSIYLSKEFESEAGDEEATKLLLEGSIARDINLSRSGLSTVDLVEEDGFFSVSATVCDQEDSDIAAVLDTGTSESVLPSDLLSKNSLTGSRRNLVGFQGPASESLEHKVSISIAGNPSIVLRVLESNRRGAIVGDNAFAAKCLLLQFRFSRLFYW